MAAGSVAGSWLAYPEDDLGPHVVFSARFAPSRVSDFSAMHLAAPSAPATRTPGITRQRSQGSAVPTHGGLGHQAAGR